MQSNGQIWLDFVSTVANRFARKWIVSDVAYDLQCSISHHSRFPNESSQAEEPLVNTETLLDKNCHTADRNGWIAIDVCARFQCAEHEFCTETPT